MTGLKTCGLRMLALIALQALLAQASAAEAPGEASLEAEMAKQVGIYRSQGEHRPRGYVIDRSLASYAETLAAGFERALAELGPADRWLDIGAGEGRAILDYATARGDGARLEGQALPEERARAVAISIEDRRTPRWHRSAAALQEDQIRYLFGRRLREYSPQELGKFRIITDVLGGFSYTDYLSQFTQKALALLELNGSFYTLLQDVHAQNGIDQPHYEGSPFLTEIKDADEAELRVCSWLRRISCVEVTCQFKGDFEPPIEVYRVRKVCEEVTVPALKLLHYAAGTPPERRFQLTQQAPEASAAER